ncbi:hypothetical protein OG534_36565 [Streptomyces sp. NBC_01294]|nr:hypothetical protein [Streptomyces sp. NBC_01294]WRZ61515.1 hypothetical protein OG534_36565 [Streptomyces sp. NBC_01294]
MSSPTAPGEVAGDEERCGGQGELACGADTGQGGPPRQDQCGGHRHGEAPQHDHAEPARIEQGEDHHGQRSPEQERHETRGAPDPARWAQVRRADQRDGGDQQRRREVGRVFQRHVEGARQHRDEQAGRGSGRSGEGAPCADGEASAQCHDRADEGEQEAPVDRVAEGIREVGLSAHVREVDGRSEPEGGVRARRGQREGRRGREEASAAVRGPHPQAKAQRVRHDVSGFPQAGDRAGILGRLPVGLGYLVAEGAAETGGVQAQQTRVHAVAVFPGRPGGERPRVRWRRSSPPLRPGSGGRWW